MMKVALLLTLSFVVTVFATEEWTDDDFSANIKENSVTLIKFYAPWCGHCKRMAPEFDKASKVLAENDPPIMLAKVDCTESGKHTCTRNGVSGYPTLKIYRGDPAQGEEYKGPREFDGIVKFMRGKAGPTSKDLLTVDDLNRFLSGPEHAIVGYFSDATSAFAKQFQSLADTLSEDFRFAHTSTPDVLEAVGKSNQVVVHQPKHLHSKLERTELVYEGEQTVTPMRKFVQANLHGLAGYRNPSNAAQFKSPLVTVYYEVDYIKNVKGSNYWRNRVMKVAKELREAGGATATFAVSNHAEFAGELEEYGIQYTDKPVVAARNAKDQKFIMTAEFSVANLKAFVTDMLAGALTPHLKSEPIPENQGPVKVVVAKNFDEVVNDPTKDVLIEFYAPWCGHCKSLAPKYDELGTKLADEDSVAIAKMDATANDVPQPYDVKGFPTIYYARKNAKDAPIKYEGAREVNDFLKFLAKESTDGLKGFDKNGKKKKDANKDKAEL